MGSELLPIIGFATVWLLIMGITFAFQYKKIPDDKILVIYGKVEPEHEHGFKVITAGREFVWPIIQDSRYIDLASYEYNINEKFISKDNVELKIKGRIVYSVSNEAPLMNNAAERLLGLDRKTIKNLGNDIIYGQVKEVVKNYKVNDIGTSHHQFNNELANAIKIEINKIGMILNRLELESID